MMFVLRYLSTFRPLIIGKVLINGEDGNSNLLRGVDSFLNPGGLAVV